MFLVEEYISPHARPLLPLDIRTEVEDVHFDIALDELEREEGMALPDSHASTWQMLRNTPSSSLQRAYPLSMGLTVHALVDGYALGVSSLETQSGALSFVVFLAIIIHKGTSDCFLSLAHPANHRQSTHGVSFNIFSFGDIPPSFRVQETFTTFQSRHAS